MTGVIGREEIQRWETRRESAMWQQREDYSDKTASQGTLKIIGKPPEASREARRGSSPTCIREREALLIP